MKDTRASCEAAPKRIKATGRTENRLCGKFEARDEPGGLAVLQRKAEETGIQDSESGSSKVLVARNALPGDTRGKKAR